MNVYYYELLRAYSSELEKENSILFVIGFSMADQHICEVTKRSARSNPTLQIIILLHSDKEVENLNKLLEVDRNPNIQVVTPEGSERYDLQNITRKIFNEIKLHRSDEQ